jgi:hypothetical protein
MVPAFHLRKLFSYNPDTGTIVRAVSAGRCSAGETVFALDRDYLHVRVTWDGRKHKIYGHVLAWVLYYGTYPSRKIAHLNDNCADNRLKNLAERGDHHHARHSRMKSNNTSGAKGISWDCRRQLWKVEITVDYKNKFVGRFADKDQALAAYIAASQEHHGDEGRVDVDWNTFRARSF